MNAKMVVARVFLYVRKLRRMSQDQLAAKLNVNESTIYKLEKGTEMPSIWVLQRLERLTNSSIKDLVAASRYANA